LAWAIEAAVTEIVRSSGTHFDPRVVEAFRQLHEVGAVDSIVAGLLVAPERARTRPAAVRSGADGPRSA
jgi:HD-GYP domain-containing protein (c-di-GMP phosphodiesterase class II)